MQSFQRGKHELLVGGLSLVFVEGFAEFAVKRIDVSAEPCRGNRVLYILFHAGGVHGELGSKRLIAYVFKR